MVGWTRTQPGAAIVAVTCDALRMRSRGVSPRVPLFQCPPTCATAGNITRALGRSQRSGKDLQWPHRGWRRSADFEAELLASMQVKRAPLRSVFVCRRHVVCSRHLRPLWSARGSNLSFVVSSVVSSVVIGKRIHE